MPSSSKKQHNFMAAIAHSPSFAKKAGVPQKVGKDFTAADKGRKFNSGGDSMNPRARKKGGALGYASGGKIDWSANEANAVKGGEKSYLPKANKKASSKKPISIKEYAAQGNDVVRRAVRSGLRPGTREFSEFIGSDGESNTRDAITAKAKSQGVKFDKYGRVKMAEGGNVSDEDTMSESAKQNISAMNKPVSTPSSAGKKRGFFGSLLTGHLKDYNAQQKARKGNVGPGGKDWKKLDKTAASSTDEDEVSEGVKKATGQDREARRAEKQARKERKASTRAGMSADVDSMLSDITSKKVVKKAVVKKKAVAKKSDSKPDASKSVMWTGKKSGFGQATSAPKKPTEAKPSRAEQFAKAKADWNKTMQDAEDRRKAKTKAKADAEKASFKPSANKPFNYARGGLVRGGGCESKGKTKCKMR